MRVLFILTIILVQSSWAALCLFSCRSTKCSQLEYYLKNCRKCTKIGTTCAKAFCQNHPQLCIRGKPIKSMSVGTNDIVDEEIRDVCLAKLYAPYTFNEEGNSSININNLNMLTITFFEQTGGEAKKRNIGTMENILVNYLLYIKPELKKLSEDQVQRSLAQWIEDTFHMTLEKANNFHYHMMIEYMRRDLYKRKGIPSQTKSEIYKNQKYPITISKLGCPSEKAY